MKSILLAAAAMIAAPAMAQDQTTPPADQSAPAPADQSMTPPADPAAPAAPSGTMQAPPAAPSQAMPAQTTGGETPAQAAQQGGYQPAGPAVSGTPAPGAPVKFQPAADPNTAYPPPAPKDSYPICKKGQYDGCTQASDVHHSGKKMHAKKRRK